MSSFSTLAKAINDLAREVGDALQLRGFRRGGSPGQVPIKTPGGDYQWKWGNPTYKIGEHAASHAQGADDEITPAAIGAQPAGDYSVEGHTHVLADVTDFDAGDYAAASHTHVSADISDATSDGNTNPGKALKTDQYGYVAITGLQVNRTANGTIDFFTGDPDAPTNSGSMYPAGLSSNPTWTLQDASGTIAFLGDIPDGSAYATAAQGALADTSVQLSGDQTIGGIKAFSSTTRPTSAGTGTPEATSLITLDDGDSRYFDYTSVGRLTAHFDASNLTYQGSATPTDGAQVSAWASTATPGLVTYSVTQGTAGARPLYKTNIQNGLPGVLFDGTDDLMQLSSFGFTSFFVGNARTVFIVCKPTVLVSTGSGTTYARPQLVANAGQYNGISVHPVSSNNCFTAWDYDAAGLVTVQSDAVAPNTACVVTHRHKDGTSSIQVNTATEATATTLRDCLNTSDMQIGTSGGSAFFTGYIFEILVYSSPLNDDIRRAVQTALMTKWGIS